MLTYLKGDATQPQVSVGNKIIAHVCNDIGAWGKGFVLSLSRRYPYAEKTYRRWYQEQENFIRTISFGETLEFIKGTGVREEINKMALGAVQFVSVEHDNKSIPPVRTYVANMIGQAGIYSKNNPAPIRYNALENCLLSVATFARIENASVHMPRIGCGLAGGEWSKIEPILERTLDEIEVFVYDFESDDARTVTWKQ